MAKTHIQSILVAGSAALLILACPGLRPAYATVVGQAFPTTPFSADIQLGDTTTKSAGPATGTLGVTSITVTNFNTTTQQVFFGAATFATGKTCGGVPVGGADPAMIIMIPPTQTVHLTYPTPLVFPKLNGISCIGISDTGTHSLPIRILINGYTQ